MKCTLCPNKCGVDREKNIGRCDVGETVKIAKYYLHPFEEPIVSGKNGSGTIFFCGCSLKCVFCQNYELSRNARGKEISVKELADIFFELERNGAENVNLVNPTHYSDKIIKALEIYRPNIPLVYNTHGYENLEILNDIDKYVDVYLPDMKYFSPSVSARYSGRKDYFDIASKAIEFMAKKPLIFGQDKMIKSGTIVRHLVLPQNASDSKRILDWFCQSKVKDNAYINVMSQYTPFGEITNYPELQRKITKREYDSVIDYALSLGVENMFYQDLASVGESYIPKWDY